MKHITNEQLVRWFARGLGLLIIVGLIILGVLAYNELGPPPLDKASVLMFIFFISTSAGILAAWKNERIGVVILSLSILIYVVLASLTTGVLDPSLIITLSPWIAVLALNYISLRLRDKKRET